MKVDELKAKVEECRENLKKGGARLLTSSSDGPIGIGLIDAIVSVLEDQDRRIDDLEKRVEGSDRIT
jgi:hypothetical protein